jgi:hypothetical protein
MQSKISMLSAEIERQRGVIMGLEQMIEETGCEKQQLLKYCHELELRVISSDVMNSNPSDVHADFSHASIMLDLQQVVHCNFCLLQSSNTFVETRCRICCIIFSQPTGFVSKLFQQIRLPNTDLLQLFGHI